MNRLAGLAGAAALTVTSGLATAVPASAAPAAALGQCTTTRGTIVAVDFAHWSGPIVRGCGVQSNGQPDSTGYDLLHDGRFTTAGDQHDGPAFMCRIGSGSFNGGTQYPTPAEDPCMVTPPSSAYWAYWIAPPGATTWQNSNYGPMSDRPVAGAVELWIFGATDNGATTGSAVPPDSLIDQLRAHNATPAGGALPPVTGANTGAPSAAHEGGDSKVPATRSSDTRSASRPGTNRLGSPLGAGSSASGSARVDQTSSAPAAATPGTDTSPPGGATIVPARAAASSRHGSRSALPLVITMVIVAALCGAGGLSLLRRRRAQAG